MGEGSGRRHVPTTAGRRRVGVDYNEALLVGQGGVLGAGEIGLGGTGTVVDCHNNGGWSDFFIRHVDVL